eukprot:CAMPEP_0172457902 /NCGR_PEP_ID=MMETSP1065-20121228/24937_1 /TAXON_ID=265537 /ORGANISM="Amphiprora paludosa, Strain CCMP125" /LENGTH=49 /DNA_ID= /DNA_START= /DNA_END= /DNA_ORIENTATION=
MAPNTPKPSRTPTSMAPSSKGKGGSKGGSKGKGESKAPGKGESSKGKGG